MIPPGFAAGCYFDPVTLDKPNVYLPHMNMRQTPMAYSPDTQYLYAVACVNPAWVRRAPTGWEFIQPVRLPGQKQYGILAAIDSRTAKIVWQKRLLYAECEGSGGALATAGGLMFHEEPDGVFQAYDAKTGDVLWRFQTGQVGLGGGAGPSAGAAATYESKGRQFVAIANNRAVWAFAIGGTVAERPAPPPPAIVREWGGRVEDASSVQLGSVRTFNIIAANRKIDWMNEYDVTPPRVRIKAGSTLTFVNKTSLIHLIEARDGSWHTDALKPGESGSVTVMKPGVYEYICHDHPWTIGQLTVE
jgi:plastocyanin